MKKRNFMFMLSILFVMIALPMFVFAGGNEQITDLMLPGWLSVVISIVTFVAGIFIPNSGSGKKIVDERLLTAAAKSVYAVVKAKNAESDGGKKITAKEWEVILSQGFDGVKYIAEAVGKTPEEIDQTE